MYLGIDLGTTFSCGAYVDEQGLPHAITNSEGENTTPSVVYFESADSVVVGQVAKDNSELYPNNVISLVKNFMGKPDPATGKPVTFVTDYGEYSPEAVSALILQKIVSDAGKSLGLKDPITDVVVTIPAYFTDPQRKATEQAIAIAGLNCLGLINEPTAAAYYYASGVKMDNADILVYDLGGGTFDATVINVSGTNIKVKSTGGLAKVGGSFFDKDIAKYVVDEIKAKHGLDLMDPEYVDEYQELLGKAEKAKIQLSNSTRTTIPIKAGKVRASVEITRDTFNGLIAKLYKRTEGVVKQAVKSAGLELKDLKKVILVGGSSRIPYIEEHLTELFGMEPSHEVNPDEVVALGAALYAKSLVSGNEVSQIVDVCSHGIGIKAYDAKEDREYNDILITRNTSLPADAHKLYKLGEDGQREITVSINEGDFKELTDVSEICTVPVTLPSKLPKNTQIDIRIALDCDQLIHIYLRLPNNGNVESEVTFDRKANMSEAQISKWKRSVAKALDGLAGRTPEAESASSGPAQDNKDISSLPGADKQENTREKTERGGIFGLVDKIRGAVDNKTDNDKKAPERKHKEADHDKIPKIVENSMKDLTGFRSVRIALRDYYNRSETAKKRALAGAIDDDNKNFIIYGAHGMGRTTAGIAVANVLEKIGASNGQMVIADLDTFDGKDETEVTTSIQTQFQNAMGGVLFIDNFEEFCSDNPAAQGPVTVDLIVKAYHAAGGNVALIIAGDKEPVEGFLKKKRKFADLFTVNEIELEGFTPAEYVTLMHKIAKEKMYVISDDADSLLERYFKDEMRLPEFDYIHRVESVLFDAITDVANKLQNKRHAKDEDRMIIRRENFALNSQGKSLDELLAELDGLTGLAGVKKEVHALVDKLKVRKRAEREGRALPGGRGNLHMVFMGHAGTGKTTVARLLGGIFRELEILPRGQVIEVTRKDLISEFVGKTAQLVDEQVKKALGGILFIDEAYSICKDDNDSFGHEAVDALVPAVENHRDDLVVILAGYTDDMNEFLKNNEGLSSRFPNKIMFDDYSIDEMMEIFRNNCSRAGFILEDGMEAAVKAVLAERVRTTDNFGNARGVRNLYEEIVKNQQSRIAGLSDWGENEEIILRKADIGSELIEAEHPKTVQELLAELNSMIGLASVKNQINSFVANVQMNEARRAAGLKTSGIGSLHMVFKGNPGTGKTTVARLVGSIMKGLGILPKGHLVECSRSDLVAGYVGQTAMKTEKVVMNAMGGVLFIDEAYTLTSASGSNDFGQEAVDQLLKMLEDRRGQFMCIVAGYTREMDEFIASNPGLERRFPNVIVFEDYSTDELCDIFKSMVSGRGLKLEEGAMDEVRTLIERQSARPNFGNAGGARNIVDKLAANMDRRLLMQGFGGDPEALVTIRKEDVLQEL